MILVRASVAAVCGAIALGVGAFCAAPASADPMVIPAPEYVPRGEPRVVERYYEDGHVIRRVERRAYRRGYVEDMFDDPADGIYRYEGRPRRIPTTRQREYDVYDGPDPYGRDARTYRYYEDPRYDPYDREPEVRRGTRLAGPPSAAGVDQPIRRAMDPKFARTVVPYRGSEPAGSIVIDTKARYLYLIQKDGSAIRYGVGVGKEGFAWKGTETISDKKEWPDWRPPAEMRQRRPELPVMMAGGPDNPLGARALYLGKTLYRIHGSNEPWTIGHAVSSGCIRMTNEDVMDLYERVGVGTTVKVI